MRQKGRTDDHELSELATRQHGVVSATQLLALGYTSARIRRAVVRGRLHRLHHRVYAVGHCDLDWNSHCLAAVLACAPAAVASHAAAGWLWGLLRYEPGTIDVTAAMRRRKRPTIRVHYAPLTDWDRAERDGIPVTSLARTMLDLAAELPPERLDRVLERAEELRLFDLRAVEELLARVTRHPGVKPLRRAITVYRPSPIFTRSFLERRFLALVEAAGLPPPSMGFNYAGFELDAFWPDERFAVELDVYETHGTRAAFERDRVRDEELKLAGVEVHRITGPHLDREPDRVIERVRTLLARRQRELESLRKAGLI
jgi:hypothetical protein